MIRSLIRTAALASVIPAVVACAGTGLSGSPGRAPGVVEPIYGAAVAGDVAVVRVSSNGCTSKSNLMPQVTRGAGVTVLTLRRTQADTCDTPARDGLPLQWTFEELGIEPGTLLQVSNPVASRQDVIMGGQR